MRRGASDVPIVVVEIWGGDDRRMQGQLLAVCDPASEASDCTSGNLVSSRIRKGSLAMESTYLYLYHGVALPASFPRGSSIASRQDQGSRP